MKVYRIFSTVQFRGPQKEPYIVVSNASKLPISSRHEVKIHDGTTEKQQGMDKARDFGANDEIFSSSRSQENDIVTCDVHEKGNAQTIRIFYVNI